ncbi:NEL-type E3 ubiquitin ligase domain-containing protein [Pseudoxanthomonas sp. UTMC 1351]|uniref:NEL-type E3 ubiquitin ligase domain-containing protein n=1 Tax=Pseudoxanthomonas sp. UTMC 1351 TaxID=2695853 RepID=UPI0034CF2BF1
MAVTLADASNVPRPNLLQRLGQALTPDRCFATAFAEVGRSAPYDWAALQAWVDRAEPGERRAEAADQIRNMQQGILDLAHLQLRDLPPLPADLRWLKCQDNALAQLPALPARLELLICSNNPLDSLPALPKALLILNVSDCPLTALPALPTNLRTLRAAQCQLTSVPPRWPANLGVLDFEGNRIAYLDQIPARILQCNLSNNLLTALPSNVQHLDRGGRLHLEGNPLSAHALEQLSQLRNDPRYVGPDITFSMAAFDPSTPSLVRRLHDAATAWYPSEAAHAAVARWTAFEGEVAASQFAQYLDRLGKSIHATQAAVAAPFRAHVGEWLEHLATHPVLRQDTFAIVAPGNEACEDRAAVVLLQMTRLRVNHDVETGHHDAHPATLLELVQGNRRLEALETIALDKMRKMRAMDDVEVVLAYPVGLRERLRLPIGVEAMRFGAVSGVTEDDLDRAEAQVKALDATFPEYLANHVPFHHVLERWDRAAFERAQEARDDFIATGYAAAVQGRIAATAQDLREDAGAMSQAGQAVLNELHIKEFGPLVQRYLEARHHVASVTHL